MTVLVKYLKLTQMLCIRLIISKLQRPRAATNHVQPLITVCWWQTELIDFYSAEELYGLGNICNLNILKQRNVCNSYFTEFL